MEHNESPCRTCDRKTELPGCFRATKTGDILAGRLVCPTIAMYQKQTLGSSGLQSSAMAEPLSNHGNQILIKSTRSMSE